MAVRSSDREPGAPVMGRRTLARILTADLDRIETRPAVWSGSEGEVSGALAERSAPAWTLAGPADLDGTEARPAAWSGAGSEREVSGVLAERSAPSRTLMGPADLDPTGTWPDHGEHKVPGPAAGRRVPAGTCGVEGTAAGEVRVVDTSTAGRQAPEALSRPDVIATCEGPGQSAGRPGLEAVAVVRERGTPRPVAGWLVLEGPSGPGGAVATPAEDTYGPEVLLPTRVTSGPAAVGSREQTVRRLGETTDRLLRHHLREGRARRGRPSLPGVPSSGTEIPGRERRTLPGMQARALTPRGR